MPIIVIHHINKLKMNPYIHFNKCRKSISTKIQLSVLSMLGIEWNFFNLIKVTYKSPQLTSHLQVKDWIISKMENKANVSNLSTLIEHLYQMVWPSNKEIKPLRQERKKYDIIIHRRHDHLCRY